MQAAGTAAAWAFSILGISNHENLSHLIQNIQIRHRFDHIVINDILLFRLCQFPGLPGWP